MDGDSFEKARVELVRLLSRMDQCQAEMRSLAQATIGAYLRIKASGFPLNEDLESQFKRVIEQFGLKIRDTDTEP